MHWQSIWQHNETNLHVLNICEKTVDEKLLTFEIETVIIFASGVHQVGIKTQTQSQSNTEHNNGCKLKSIS